MMIAKCGKFSSEIKKNEYCSVTFHGILTAIATKCDE